VAQVVGAELELEALGGHPPFRQAHHPGVVDQHIQSVVAGQDVVGQPVNGVQVGQIEGHHLDPRHGGGGQDALMRGPAALGVAAGQQHGGALGGQLEGGVVADAGVGAGDEHGPSGLVGDVGGGPSSWHGWLPGVGWYGGMQD
jgi:hypothetical protein